jgi:hypothetical protein
MYNVGKKTEKNNLAGFEILQRFLGLGNKV